MKFKICQEIGTSWKAKRMDGLPVSVFTQVILVIMTGASLSSSLYFILIAELSRAKRAIGAPWVRKFGKLSIR